MSRFYLPTMAKPAFPARCALAFSFVLFAVCATCTRLSAFQIVEIKEAAEKETAAEQEVVPVPEITGKDFEGEEFSLSDYRGKVVLLYFWGDWCPPCRALNPQLNELVTANKERPFALVGVNTDPEPHTVQQLVKEGEILWKSFQDDKHEIANQWKVNAYPSLFLIDASGNIVESGNSLRDFKNLGGKIDELVLPLMGLGEEELESLLDAAKDKRPDRR